MQVNVINLPHRVDRMLSANSEATQQGFELKRWDGFIDKPRFKGIFKAHQQVVRYAKENNLPSTTIMEDDCIFTAPGAFDFYIKNTPKEFDLYFGMVYSAQLNEENKIINGFSGLTLYTVHESFYDFFLSLEPKDHLDRWLGNWAFEKKYFVCKPYVCRQTGGYSDNHQRKMTYNAFEMEMTFYQG